MIIKVLIVDDEPPAILLVRSFIERTPGLEVVAAETDPIVAMQKIDRGEIKAHAAFLDIDMPKMNGLEMKKQLSIPVIFTTGHREFATEAFELDAVDYLTKVFDYDRFLKAIKKLREKLEMLNQGKKDNLIFIKLSGKAKKAYIDLDDIYAIESLNGKLFFKVGEDVYPTAYSIDHIIKQLASKNFIRVHRSFIVNKYKIKEVMNKKIKLRNGNEIPIGEGYEKSFFEVFNSDLLFD